MPTPGFRANILDSDGTPTWISELANCDDPIHVLYVARGLGPREALEALEARPESIRSCQLPDVKPPEGISLPAAALGPRTETAIDLTALAGGELPMETATLLAGSFGAWTFVYDDSGFTAFDIESPLSYVTEVAATSLYHHYADISLAYAVRGAEPIGWTTYDLDLARDLPGMPAELRAAFDAAGVVEVDNVGTGEFDNAIFMRVVCALAGLTFTLDDLRGIPLLAATLG